MQMRIHGFEKLRSNGALRAVVLVRKTTTRQMHLLALKRYCRAPWFDVREIGCMRSRRRSQAGKRGRCG
jgi:hypothetical protein